MTWGTLLVFGFATAALTILIACLLLLHSIHRHQAAIQALLSAEAEAELRRKIGELPPPSPQGLPPKRHLSLVKRMEPPLVALLAGLAALWALAKRYPQHAIGLAAVLAAVAVTAVVLLTQPSPGPSTADRQPPSPSRAPSPRTPPSRIPSSSASPSFTPSFTATPTRHQTPTPSRPTSAGPAIPTPTASAGPAPTSSTVPARSAAPHSSTPRQTSSAPATASSSEPPPMPSASTTPAPPAPQRPCLLRVTLPGLLDVCALAVHRD